MQKESNQPITLTTVASIGKYKTNQRTRFCARELVFVHLPVDTSHRRIELSRDPLHNTELSVTKSVNYINSEETT